MEAYTITAVREVRQTAIPEPTMGPRDVLIEVHYVGLCGSDLNSYRGQMPLVTLPRIPGHEVGGVITNKGAEVPASFPIGAKVTVSPYTSCGTCPSCRAGRPNTCEYNQTLGIQRDGALTQRIAIPHEKVYVNDALSLRELALVEPLSVGYHGANRGEVRETDTVFVLGCGTVGMGALLGSVRKGARVVVTDIDESKLGQARKFGADVCFNSTKQDPLAAIRDLTRGEGASVVIEAAGTQSTYQLALEAVCFSGRVVLIGYSKGTVSIEAPLIVRKEVTIFGSRNSLGVFPAIIAMFEKKEKPFTDLITRVYPFQETPRAFADWDANPGTVSKYLIDIRSSGA
jgi:L-galactonate 5-dehydrogenase